MPATPAPPAQLLMLGMSSETPIETTGIGIDAAQPTPEPPPPLYVVYTVQDGDTVGGLSARHSISPSSILWSNPDLQSADSLTPGQPLRVPLSDGVVYDVRPGDTLSDIAARFGVDVQAVIEVNGLESADSIAENQTIFVPGGIMPEPVATSTPTPEPTAQPLPVPTPPQPDDTPSGLSADAVELVRSRIGSPYVSGAAGPNGFDCSGLVFWVYSQLGLDVPRSAPDQFQWATPVGSSEMQPGDIVFFENTYPSSQRITHVGIYVGGGGVVMAVDNGDIVREVSLAESYWSDHFAGAGWPH